MATKKNLGRLANDAASVIIREIGEKHFRAPPDGAFTVFDVMQQFSVGENKIRNQLERMVESGELKSGKFGFKKYFWRAK